MKIEINNIGMLKSANVHINGLTVIAGENDTGKSTIGKVLFCIIKAISRYEEDFQESREYKIEVILDRLFFQLRKSISELDDETYFKLRDLFSLDRLYHYFDTEEEDYIFHLKEEIYSLVQDKNKDRVLDSLEHLINELEFILYTPENKQKSIQNALNKVFRSEFNSNILMHNAKKGFIKLYENDLLLLSIIIDKDNKVLLENEVEPIEINEATFVETPLILNNHDLLIKSQTGLDISKRSSRRLGVPYTTLHTKDLFDKLKAFNFTLYLDHEFEVKIKNDVNSIINGSIIYDTDEKDFVYIKDGQKIPIKNTATGIKAFGIIQLLIDSGFISRTSMLILDEPEIHLHPKWQLEYAKVIALLAKNDVPLLVTSHSPYMIEALKRYSDIEGLERKTNFYLSKNCIIEDKNKLEDIFRVLSEPFNTFRKMDAENFKD